MSHTPRFITWLARRAPCLHVIKTCAVIATLYAKALAAPQRGGGQSQLQAFAINCKGRLPMSEGGDLNSLCCAAAGIFALDVPATADAAYPTTSVRGAQKVSPSLRSKKRPHAQLVKGYTRPLLAHESPACAGFTVPISYTAKAISSHGGAV